MPNIINLKWVLCVNVTVYFCTYITLTNTHALAQTHTSHIIAHIIHTRTLINTSTSVRVYVRTRTPDPYCIYLLIAERIQTYIKALSS